MSTASRRVARLRPVVPVPHTRRLIEQNHDIARAAADRSGRRALRQERPRERRHDQRHGRRAQQQQEPMTNPAAPDGLIGNPPYEHQRRKLDDALALALNQVDQHRNGDRAETHEEEGR